MYSFFISLLIWIFSMDHLNKSIDRLLNIVGAFSTQNFAHFRFFHYQVCAISPKAEPDNSKFLPMKYFSFEILPAFSQIFLSYIIWPLLSRHHTTLCMSLEVWRASRVQQHISPIAFMHHWMIPQCDILDKRCII